MKEVIDYIETKRLQFERHPFFTELLDNENLSGEQRLAWGPGTVPFIMGYSDLNKQVFRNEANDEDPVQHDLNMHTYEEDFHWQWMLDDMEVLNANPKLSFSDAVRLIWSPDFRVSREVPLRLTSLVRTTDTHGVFAIVEAIEAVSVTMFQHCQGIRLSNGQECQFFGTKHYLAESGHGIKSADCKTAQEIRLTEEARETCRALVDRVFDLFSNWLDSLCSFAGKYGPEFEVHARQAISASAALPRAAAIPPHLRAKAA
jgi:hypothetical protein